MGNRTDQRVSQRFGFGAHACLADRLVEVETLQGGGGIAENGVDPLPDGIRRLSSLPTDIDCKDAEISGLSGYLAKQPHMTFAVVHHGPVSAPTPFAARGQFLGLALDLFRHSCLIG